MCVLFRHQLRFNIKEMLIGTNYQSPGFITNHPFQQFSVFIHQFSFFEILQPIKLKTTEETTLVSL